jgi:hypothetical protein
MAVESFAFPAICESSFRPSDALNIALGDGRIRLLFFTPTTPIPHEYPALA